MKYALIAILTGLILLLPLIDARVDAVFDIFDENGRQIYMRTPDGKIIYGNVLVGERIRFDASRSNSRYPIDTYFWDFDGDGKYDKISHTPIVYHVYDKPGTYNAKLLAKASTAPPAGDGDVVYHKIVVVEYYVKPVGNFEIMKENGTYFFNASKSYDPDGYIRSYSWDFDGDGIIDFSSFNPTAEWKYDMNGYYRIKLKVMDYDMQFNSTIRVIKVDGLEGNIDETEGRVEIINKCGKEIEANVTLNNKERYNITIQEGGKYVFTPLLNPSYNEIYIEACGNSRIFVFNGTKIAIEVEKNGIHISSNSSPGFEIILFIAAILLAIMRKNEKRNN